MQQWDVKKTKTNTDSYHKIDRSNPLGKVLHMRSSDKEMRKFRVYENFGSLNKQTTKYQRINDDTLSKFKYTENCRTSIRVFSFSFFANLNPYVKNRFDSLWRGVHNRIPFSSPNKRIISFLYFLSFPNDFTSNQTGNLVKNFTTNLWYNHYQSIMKKSERISGLYLWISEVSSTDFDWASENCSSLSELILSGNERKVRSLVLI